MANEEATVTQTVNVVTVTPPAASSLSVTSTSGGALSLTGSAGSLTAVTITPSVATLTVESLFAPKNSPVFTGVPLAPTASAGTNNTQIATTAYVDSATSLENTLDEMDDTTITSVGDNELLQYDSSSSKWINQTFAEAGVAPVVSPTFTGTPLAPTASAATNTTQLATTAYVTTAVSNLVDSSPSTLNTLNELAAALNDDASFSTTVTNSIATKLPLAGGTMSGPILHSAGSDSAPSISWAGDSDTGIYHYAANSFAFATSGALRGQFQSGGKLKLWGGLELDGNTALIKTTLTVGVDDTGHDVKFFGATSGRYLLWDESADSLHLTDNTKLKVGTSGQLELFSDGTNKYIRGWGGDVRIENYAADKDIIFAADNGSGSAVDTYFRIDGGDHQTHFFKATKHYDNVKAKFGHSDDLQLQHASGHSYIENSTGHLYINNHDENKMVYFRADDGTGSSITEYFRVDGSANQVIYSMPVTLIDDKKLNIGTGNDLQIYHSGTTSFLRSTSDDLRLANAAGDNIFRVNGDVAELYYNDSPRLGTTTDGIQLYGNGYIDLPDNGRARFGQSQDLAIYHSTTGPHSYIDNITGDLFIRNNSNDCVIIGHNANKGLIYCPDGRVELRFNDVKKFETTSTGATVTGDISLNNSTTATKLELYETYSDASNYERSFFRHASSFLEIGTEGLGTGASTASGIKFRTTGVSALSIDAGGLVTVLSRNSASSTNILSVGGSSNGYMSVRHIEGKASNSNAYGPLYINYLSNNNVFIASGGGNVGIGTTTPEAKLDIKTASSAWNVGASFNDSVVRISGEADGTNQGGLGLSYTNSGGAIIGSVQHGNDYKPITMSGRTFKFEYGSTQPRFFIDSVGKVGIGVTNPAEKLGVAVDTDASAEIGRAHVGFIGHSDYAGFSHIDRNNTTDYALIQDTNGQTIINSAASKQIKFAINNTNVGVWDSNGNFGIGTYSPSAKLSVIDDGSLTQDIVQIKGGGSSGDYDMLRVEANNGDDIFRVNALSYNVLMPDSDTKVGIGTTSPSHPLHLVAADGAISGDWVCRLTNSEATAGQNFGLKVDAGSNASDNSLEVSSLAGTSYFKVRGDGNVGIGTTSPSAKLNIKSATYKDFIVLDRTADSNVDQVIHLTPSYDGTGSHTQLAVAFSTSDPVLRIEDTGNIGIGIQSPVAKLHVVGTARISGHTDLQSSVDISNTTRVYTKLSVGNSAWITPTQVLEVGTDTDVSAIIGRAKVGYFGGSDYAAFGHLDSADSDYAIRQQNNGNTYINAGSSRNIEFRQANSTQGGFTAAKDFFVGPSDTNNTVYVDVSENRVGIGTYAPSEKLDVIGRIRSSYNSGDYFEIGSSDNGGFVVGKSGGTEIVNIRTYGDSFFKGGNVGIGTDAPAEELHIYSSDHARLRVEGNQNTRFADLQLKNADQMWVVRLEGTSLDFRIRDDTHASEPFTIKEATSTGSNDSAIVIDGDANVSLGGITSVITGGTSSPTGVNGLHLMFDNISSQTSWIKSEQNGTSNRALAFGASSYNFNYGNVGIGIAVPAYPLDVQATGAQLAQIKRTNGGSCEFLVNPSAGDAKVVFQNNGTAVWTIGKDNSDNSFRIAESGALETDPRFIVDAGGNVGIGNTNPSNKLHIDGGLQFTASSYTQNAGTIGLLSNNLLYIRGGSAGTMVQNGDGTGTVQLSSSYTRFELGASEKMRLNTTGLGIGAQAPAQKLHLEFADTDTSFSGGTGGAWGSEGLLIENTSSTTDTMAMIQLRTGDADFHIAGIRQGTNDNDLGFFAEGSEKARLTNAGYLGIGTNDPTSKLTVVGGQVEVKGSNDTSAVTGMIVKTSSSSSQGFFGVEGSGTGYLSGSIARATLLASTASSTALQLGSAGVVRATIASNGKVGIGVTAPDTSLHVEGPITISRTGLESHKSLIHMDGNFKFAANSGYSISFHTDRTDEANSECARFHSSGKFGLGTVLPSEKLDVIGTARVGYSATNGHLIGSKAYTITHNFTTGLTVSLAHHTACHVKVFITGDWANHSALTYVGEFIIQNSGDGYSEPGIILTQQDNLHSDSVTAKIVDPSTAGGSPNNFTIQFQAVSDTSESISARLCYHIMGDALSVT